MKKEFARNQSHGIHVDEGSDHASKSELNKSSEVPKFIQARTASVCDRDREFPSSADRKDMGPPSQDMFESLTQAVKMIKRWA